MERGVTWPCRRSSRRLNESPRAVLLKRILRRRHRLVVVFVVVVVAVYAVSAAAVAETPAASRLTKTPKEASKNLGENRPRYKCRACCGLTFSFASPSSSSS